MLLLHKQALRGNYEAGFYTPLLTQAALHLRDGGSLPQENALGVCTASKRRLILHDCVSVCLSQTLLFGDVSALFAASDSVPGFSERARFSGD